jgi:histidine triad (HIT) family protein
MQEKTVFERIIAGELQSWKVFEDDSAIAILDITPVNKGHVIVIPKKRYSNIYDLPESLFAHLMTIVHKLAPAIKKATGAEGLNIIMNNEKAGGHITNHAHIHVVPRFANDGYESWEGKMIYEEGEMEIFSQKIVESL